MKNTHMTPEMLSRILEWVKSGKSGTTSATGVNIYWDKNPIDMTDVEIVMLLASEVKSFQVFVAELSLAIFFSKMVVQARRDGKPLPSRDEVVAHIKKFEQDAKAVIDLTQDKTNEMLSEILKKKKKKAQQG